MNYRHGQPTATFETLPPARAAEMLATSDGGNRPLKRVKMEQYAREMASGKWVTNGEPIIFDADGHLIDGHHRLTACVKADTTFATLVVRGAPSEAKMTVDMGASRKAGDALHFSGYKNSTQLAAIVRNLMCLRIGTYNQASPTSQEIFDFIEEYPAVEASAAFVRNFPVKRVGALLGSIHFIACRHGERELVTDFATVIKTGVPSMTDCAAHAYRERAIRDSLAGKRITPTELQLLFIAAWEKFRTGTPVKLLKPASRYAIRGWK